MKFFILVCKVLVNHSMFHSALCICWCDTIIQQPHIILNYRFLANATFEFIKKTMKILSKFFSSTFCALHKIDNVFSLIEHDTTLNIKGRILTGTRFHLNWTHITWALFSCKWLVTIYYFYIFTIRPELHRLYLFT